jgi:hypothetical protein
MRGWRVEHGAVQSLANSLGLEKPVSVVMSVMPHSWMLGAQASGPDGHVIRLNRDQDAEKANLTLCHEIRHCFQRERFADGADADALYLLANLLYGYEGNPLEQDADEYAEATAPHVRLIVATDTR